MPLFRVRVYAVFDINQLDVPAVPLKHRPDLRQDILNLLFFHSGTLLPVLFLTSDVNPTAPLEK
jgi:hypothetical protein